MTEHIPTSKIELFAAQGLPETEVAVAARHLADCSDCHQEFVATLRRQRETADVSFTLDPEFWFRHDHVDYEQLVDLAEDKLDSDDREVIDVHLKVCPSCREDVRSFLAFREQIAPELENSYAPAGPLPARTRSLSISTLWHSLALKPIYAAAVVIIGIAIVIGAALLLKRRAENLEAKQVPTPQSSPGPASDRAVNLLSPQPTPNESPTENPDSPAIVVLKDRGVAVTVDKTGTVVGLDDVPNDTREAIAQVFLSERLEPPAILKELRGQRASLRGSTNAQPFKLTYPSRTVIISDQPRFSWGKASGANSYRVYVHDSAGKEIVKSGELPSERTEWKSPKPLKRGEIYLWTVVATVDSKEVVSPGPASAEMKFGVLSTSSLSQLNTLRKSSSHLALGVFYAREGMISEAERELRIVVRENPGSQRARSLLSEIQSWRKQ